MIEIMLENGNVIANLISAKSKNGSTITIDATKMEILYQNNDGLYLNIEFNNPKFKGYPFVYTKSYNSNEQEMWVFLNNNSDSSLRSALEDIKKLYSELDNRQIRDFFNMHLRIRNLIETALNSLKNNQIINEIHVTDLGTWQ